MRRNVHIWKRNARFFEDELNKNHIEYLKEENADNPEQVIYRFDAQKSVSEKMLDAALCAAQKEEMGSTVPVYTLKVIKGAKFHQRLHENGVAFHVLRRDMSHLKNHG